VAYVNVVYHVKVHARDHYEYDPVTGDVYMLLQIFFGVTRVHEGTGEVLHHTNVREFAGYLSSQLSLTRLGVSYSADAFTKSWRISLPGLEEVFTLSVPPFNGSVPLEPNVDEQVHSVQVWMPEPTPPPVLPPPPIPTPVGPPEGPPITVILEPPDETSRPITLPPPVEPPQPIDWRPGPLPPDVTPPPRTRETDVFTLRQFAAKWGHQIDRYALNVPLDGGEVVEDLPEPYRSFWQRLTMHKADIVFERKGIVYVAEIKPRLSRGAIGEAITAHELFKRLYRFPLETRAAVICQTAHPTLIQTASWLDCLVFVTEQVDTGQPPGLYKRIGR
jgi:hypothetical protein